MEKELLILNEARHVTLTAYLQEVNVSLALTSARQF